MTSTVVSVGALPSFGLDCAHKGNVVTNKVKMVANCFMILFLNVGTKVRVELVIHFTDRLNN